MPAARATNEVVGVAVFEFALELLAPRLAFRSRWVSCLSSRRLAIYVPSKALEIFLIRRYVSQYILAQAAGFTRDTQALTESLGRDPTPEEVSEHFGTIRGFFAVSSATSSRIR